ncbi:T9SS type A sorting domain-containing protein [Gelidibacter maritimus]|uniref:T9SS type A sorting domain-containing protein n=1 Tax=Gelidibacter maritimus TaxID=2761487 RepID=A0A7W2R2U9_9FLAO|nr:T9SS type A sorting domain-containing protein [Gelidibacter maritimus]MBA6151285.1 T9SS type A sorting domain-containing protein [Gelidibacter maritimus]
MKKTTLAFLGILLTSFCLAQTYTTGTMELYNQNDDVFTARVDVTSTLVTLTLVGPDNSYLGFGFGTQTMGSGGDVVLFYDDVDTPAEDFQLSDRKFIGTGPVPEVDTHQDWTLVSNTLENGQRTVVGTRVLDTGHDDDYVFSTSDSSLDFAWAIGSSYELKRHSARGGSMQSFTLSQDTFTLSDFVMTPNPGLSKFELRLPSGVSNVKLQVYDVLGKNIFSKILTTLSTTVDVSKWNSGVYLVRVTSNNGSQTKRFVKQ